MTSIDVINQRINANKTYRPREGIIVAVRSSKALVQPISSNKKIPCSFDPQSGVAVGKRCTFIWVQGRKEYVVSSVYGVKNTVLTSDQDKAGFELSPPSNLHASPIDGGILVTWNCPPQQDITFDVMFNTSATEVSAWTYRTRGGQHTEITEEPELFFRIRSITENWRYSSWTVWGSEVRGTGSGGGSSPADSTYIVQIPDGDLPNAQALSALSTGLMKSTTTTGVVSTVAAPAGAVVGDSDSQTLTNKTIDADSNTLTNVGSSEIKSEMITGFSELTSVDAAADFMLISDTSASGALKKVKPQNIPTTDADALHKSIGNEIHGLGFENPATGDVFVFEDSSDGYNKKYITAQDLKDFLAIHTNVAAEITTLTEKTTPVSNDLFIIEDSAASNVKKKLKVSSLLALGATDTNAIHKSTSAEISAITEKTTPIAADLLLMEDSAASNAKKRVQIGNLPFGDLKKDGSVAMTGNLKLNDHALQLQRITAGTPPAGNYYLYVLTSTDNLIFAKDDGTFIVLSDGDFKKSGSVSMTGDFDLAAHAVKLDDIATPANPSAGTYKLYLKSDGNLYLLDSAGTEVQLTRTEDGTAIHDDVDGEIHAITEKTTPVNDDEILIEDSEDSYSKKRMKMSNLPGGSGTDANAIHDNIDGEIDAITEKTTPVDDDILLLEDSEDTFSKKKVKLSSLVNIGSGGVINVSIRVVTASGAVTITTSDYVVIVNKTVGAATTVNLPSSPTTGDTYVIKDGKGDAGTNNITITPAAGNIDGAGTFVMSSNYMSISVVYNGTQWNIV